MVPVYFFCFFFCRLRDSPYKVWKDIRWDEILKEFPDGVTKQFLHKMCGSIVRQKEKYAKIPLEELAEFCLQKIKTSKRANKRLKRLTLDDNGNLVKVKHETDEHEVPINREM